MNHIANAIKLPVPIGPFGFKTATYHLVDTARNERHNPARNRELLVHAWIPVQKHDESTAPYPVILFSHGAGESINSYTSLLEELASHGYAVFGITHPYLAGRVEFPDGRVITIAPLPDTKEGRWEFAEKEHAVWVQDQQFVLDQLALMNESDPLPNKVLDLDRVGAMGHSFGGTVGIDFCAVDSRCTAAINMDGIVLAENPKILQKPCLFIMGAHMPPDMPEAAHMQAENLKRVHEALSASTAPFYLVELQGAGHMSFGDFYLMNPAWTTAPLEPKRGIEIVRALIVDFFDAYLKGQQLKLLKADAVSMKYSEAVVTRNRE